jgi:predicted ArsR family transcriptional regulator
VSLPQLLGVSPNRVEVIAVLAKRQASVTELMAETGLSRTGVHKHLRPLCESGLVAWSARRTAASGKPVRFYVLDGKAFERLAWELVDSLTPTGLGSDAFPVG